jgi:hypothetical protein
MADAPKLEGHETLAESYYKLNHGIDNANEALRRSVQSQNNSLNANKEANQAKERAEEANRIVENVQKQLDSVVTSGDSGPEAAQGRIDTQGKTHTSLKARLDSDYQNNTFKLAEFKKDVETLFVNILNPPKGIPSAPIDGDSDSSVTIQKCVDFINANGGGFVYIPFQLNGFVIKKRIAWKSNVGLISSGSVITVPSSDTPFQAFYLSNCSNVNFVGKIRIKSTNDKKRAIGRGGQGSNVYGVYIGGNSKEIYIDYIHGENLEYAVNFQGSDTNESRDVYIKEISFLDTYQPFFINRFANVKIDYIRGVIKNILMDKLDHVIYINDACVDITFDTIQASNLNEENPTWAVQINPTSYDGSKRNKRITFNKIHLDGSFSGFVAAHCEGTWISQLTVNMNGKNNNVIGAYGGANFEIGNVTVEGAYGTFLTCLGDGFNMNELSIRGGKINASINTMGGNKYVVRGEYINKLNINNMEFNNITSGGTSFYLPTSKENNSIIFSNCQFNFRETISTYPFTFSSGNIEFKECKFSNSGPLYDQVINAESGADIKVMHCTLVNFKTFLYWNMKGTGRIFDSVLLDDNSIINGVTNREIKTLYGNGSPEAVITAKVGSVYYRNDGGIGTTYYVKESGIGNTGWVSK